MTDEQGITVTNDGKLSEPGTTSKHGWGVSTAEFIVWGAPRPQGSMKALISRSTGKAFVKPSGNYVEWRNALVTQVSDQLAAGVLPRFLDGPVGVSLLFAFKRPQSHPKRRVQTDMGVKYDGPDVDKLIRAVLDGLTVAGMIEDDRQVTYVDGMKVFVGSPFIRSGMSGPMPAEGCAVRIWQHPGGYNVESFK